MKKETIERKGCKPPLDAFQFVGIRIPNNRDILKLRCN
jgi:hypothetical protein